MQDETQRRAILQFTPRKWPVASIIWLFVSIIILLIGTRTISLRDEQRFVNDIVLEAQPGDSDNQAILFITAGIFEYDISPYIPEPIQVGVFTAENPSPLAAGLFDAVSEITEVDVDPAIIKVTYKGDIQPEQILGRLRRVLIGFVSNASDTITTEVARDTDNTLIFTTSDERFLYPRFVPALIPAGSQEIYKNRDEGLDGSTLARKIFEEVTSIQTLTIQPDRLIVTYREGALRTQVTRQVTEALNAFYPRASLLPHLWALTLFGSTDTIIAISPLDTGLPLYAFTLTMSIMELMLFVALRGSSNKLIRPLIRSAGVFLFFWSIFGHEPLWDYVLGMIFPTSRQLVYPTATVIEFAAQHLELVIVSSLITIPFGLLIGILVTRASFREFLPLVSNLVNSGQTVPTIAIVAIMAPLIGFGFWPAIIALIVYGLLPVVRNTIAGLEAVDNSIIDSARGMGMTPAQILLRIELPIASRIVMAGIRTSMVINVGTATLGAFVGSGGLGTPIASGLSMTIDPFILLGAFPAALLAILADYMLGRLEFVVTPKGLLVEA